MLGANNFLHNYFLIQELLLYILYKCITNFISYRCFNYTFVQIVTCEQSNEKSEHQNSVMTRKYNLFDRLYVLIKVM